MTEVVKKETLELFLIRSGIIKPPNSSSESTREDKQGRDVRGKYRVNVAFVGVW